MILAQETTGGVHFSGTELITFATPITLMFLGAVGTIFKLLMSAKDKAFADMVTAKDLRFSEMQANYETYKTLAADARKIMDIAVTTKLAQDGKPTPEPIARVVPEHRSPVTEAQAIAADQATLRAAITAAALALGEPARVVDVKRDEHDADKNAEAVAAAKEKIDTAKRAERLAAAAPDDAGKIKVIVTGTPVAAGQDKQEEAQP